MVNSKLQLHFLLLLLAGALVLSFFIFRPFLAPLALAMVFAVVLQPFYRRVVRSMGNRESIGALVTVVISIVCVLLPLSFLGTRIFQESVGVYNSLVTNDGNANFAVSFFKDTGRALEGSIPGSARFFENLSVDLDAYAKQGLTWLIAHVGVALSGVSVFVLNLFIFFVALYYLLRDGKKLKQALVSLSPLEDKDDEMVFGRLALAVNSVIKGNLTIALIQGVMTAIGLTIFGVPNAVLFGTIAAVAALIPAVGTALVLAPATLYLFVTGDTIPGIGLLIWWIFAVGLIDNFLGPKLVGRGMRLHPLFVLLSVLGGIALFGPIGIFLGPLALSLLFAFITIYSYLADPQRAPSR
ncbi:hypothetical protein COU18_00595 [Candidatus Kaiserbacteria bacterium CG10_big_fil_rev_8_21_14_0_10_51_14]|uniref:AI-2E family transporter n=1 Tax=Candidatus Kaiserbacteria bacterium CG10_big_fil_rev_8_21_14_0_10_51_14 TaxID=1974610 RepID=A0A2H0UBW5_9BACT|nr:MAG: hypothetical protein COU18_00595 [Candidatus Kaiserbacteria bacterium CG10_big_fil_rev_8_21_14_0_10_51_14]